MKQNSHLQWSWILMVSFFMLSIIDIRFALLGFACMGAPLFHAFRGQGKIHCAKYCPRASFLQKFLNQISLNNNLPKMIKTHFLKNILIVVMLIMMSISFYHAGTNLQKIGFALFRLMLATSIIGIAMGIIYKPRSWCTICPMGTITGKIKEKA